MSATRRFNKKRIIFKIPDFFPGNIASASEMISKTTAQLIRSQSIKEIGSEGITLTAARLIVVISSKAMNIKRNFGKGKVNLTMVINVNRGQCMNNY